MRNEAWAREARRSWKEIRRYVLDFALIGVLILATAAILRLPLPAQAARWGFEQLDRMEQIEHLLEQSYHQLGAGDYLRARRYLARLAEVCARDFPRADNESARGLDQALAALDQFIWLVEEKLVIERPEWFQVAQGIARACETLYRRAAAAFARRGYEGERRFSQQRAEHAGRLVERWTLPRGKSHRNEELEEPFRALIRGIGNTTAQGFRHFSRSIDHNLQIRDGEETRQKKREEERQRKLR